MIKEFKPEFSLTQRERGMVAQTVATEGYSVINKIYSNEISRMILDLMNKDAANDAEVLAAYKVAKAAAQFHEAVTARLNFEVSMYINFNKKEDKPVDLTEEAIYYGERPSTELDILRDAALFEEGVI